MTSSSSGSNDDSSNGGRNSRCRHDSTGHSKNDLDSSMMRHCVKGCEYYFI